MIRLTKSFILSVLIFTAGLVFWFILEKEKQEAQVIFLDVGQGDSQLVLLPGDVQILIDAGPSADIAAKLGQYLPFYDKEIELAILTHPHADHLRGFVSVFRNYRIKNFMFSGANYESRVYADFIAALQAEGSNVYLAQAGDTISFVKHSMSDKNVQNLILHILAPLKNDFGKNFKSIHDAMVVGQLNLAGKKFLLMGDAEEDLENQLIASNAIQNIDVLKVGHHGSKTSTSIKLLKSAQPEEAIIQVGNNSYGHPYPAVLNRLREFGVKVFRNDQLGDVVYK
ncbi:MAG: MBL fold metallo-hydrolase [Candidatus Sungbacteria bacterium]|uniref:MBL fold metallo-hydrolase n=1 Tax=Candidatus Sungiibacteriota bacterium TaxID=2750080 RepID=A0A932DSA8_9BACT|nr:MBL fold metallo-hydrolase [Candidatus Sungbacteria bacterium]MBI2466081.1 MBL fold metallo-hydrolase [Candidatus Sungbacteria bacterium]